MKFARYFLATTVLCTSWLATGQASPTLNSSPNTQSAGRLIHDITTGRSYREQMVSVAVPTTAWESRPTQQTVYEPKYVTSFVPTQNLVYQPYTTYVWQPKVRGRFNPFRQTVVTYQYKPVTTWQATMVRNSVPVTTQQWVASQRTVMVSQPVQRTETRQQVVYQEVQPQPQNADVTIASRVVPSYSTVASVEPLFGQGRMLARLRNGQAAARLAQFTNPNAGLRPVSTPTQFQTNVQTANYSAPLRSAARSSVSSRDPLQAGLSATVLR